MLSLSTSISISSPMRKNGLGFVLDETTNAAAAYSLNQLRSAYSGNAVRVRRASDNAETNIGFDSNGFFDSSTYTTFISATTGYVTTWYDQTGNGYNLTQTTTADQPQLLLDRGYYALKCNANEFVQNASFIGAQTDSSISVVWATPVTSFSSTEVGFSVSTTPQQFFCPSYVTARGPMYRGAAGGGGDVYGGDMVTDFQYRQHTYTWTGGASATAKIYAAGAQTHLYLSGVAFSQTIARPSFTYLSLGEFVSNYGDLYFREFIVWDSEVDAGVVGDVYFNQYPNDFVQSSETFYLNIGDSLSTSDSYTSASAQWTDICYGSGGLNVTHWSTYGIPGASLDDMIQTEATAAWSTYMSRAQNATEKIVVILCGINDINLDGLTGAQAFAKLETLVANVKAAGADKIIVSTLIDCPVASQTEKDAFNTLVKADTISNVDAINDTTLDSELEDSSNTTYFNADRIHLKDAGAAILGARIRATIESL